MAFAFIIFLFDFSLSFHFFNWFFLSPHKQSLSPNRCSFLFKLDFQLLPQPQTSFSLFAPQIKLQFPVQNKTQKLNNYKPNRSSSYQRKNKGIDDGGEVELGAKDGEAMKINVRAVSEVREGEVRRRNVHDDHACRRRWNPIFIQVGLVELGFGLDWIEWNGMGLVAICSICGVFLFLFFCFLFFCCNLGWSDIAILVSNCGGWFAVEVLLRQWILVVSDCAVNVVAVVAVVDDNGGGNNILF